MDFEARSAGLRRQQDERRHREQVRRYAVSDVVDRNQPLLGTAVLWGLKVDTLRQWIAADRPSFPLPDAAGW